MPSNFRARYCQPTAEFRFIDPDGTHWMVYAHEWAQVQDGTRLAVKMKNDWSARIGDPVLMFAASQGPWVRPHPRADTFVTDGPVFHRMKNGKLVMIWSSFVKGHGYGMGQAISESGTIAGPWRHAEKPFFGGYGEDGGHAMVFRDFSGELLMALHQPNGGNRERAKNFPPQGRRRANKTNKQNPKLIPAASILLNLTHTTLSDS